MKKNVTRIVSLVSVIAISLLLAKPAHADIAAGEQVFLANCAACHSGGNNAIMPDKTLKKDALEENGMNTSAAIQNQVTNGKNAMPAFGGRLDTADISNVAEYVLNQSEIGW